MTTTTMKMMMTMQRAMLINDVYDDDVMVI